MMTVESSSELKLFIPHNEIAGWKQGPISPRPINGVVIGRELREVYATSEGINAVVESYYEVTGNGFLLLSLPGANLHNGWSHKKEVEIRRALPLESAMKLDFSPTSILIREGITYDLDTDKPELTNPPFLQIKS